MLLPSAHLGAQRELASFAFCSSELPGLSTVLFVCLKSRNKDITARTLLV